MGERQPGEIDFDIEGFITKLEVPDGLTDFKSLIRQKELSSEQVETLFNNQEIISLLQAGAIRVLSNSIMGLDSFKNYLESIKSCFPKDNAIYGSNTIRPQGWFEDNILTNSDIIAKLKTDPLFQNISHSDNMDLAYSIFSSIITLWDEFQTKEWIKTTLAS